MIYFAILIAIFSATLLIGFLFPVSSFSLSPAFCYSFAVFTLPIAFNFWTMNHTRGILAQLSNTCTNMQRYLDYYEEHMAFPNTAVQTQGSNACTKLNQTMFIYLQLAIRNHDGTKIYHDKELHRHKIKWGSEGYSRSNRRPDIIKMYTTDVFLLDEHGKRNLVKENNIENVQHIFESVAKVTAKTFAEKYPEKCTFPDLNEEIKYEMLAHFLNGVDVYGISLLGVQHKIARNFIATRWDNKTKTPRVSVA